MAAVARKTRAQRGSSKRAAARSRCPQLFKSLFNGSAPEERLCLYRQPFRALPRQRNDPEALLCRRRWGGAVRLILVQLSWR